MKPLKVLLVCVFLLWSSTAFATLARQYQIQDLGDIRLAVIAHDDARVIGLQGDTVVQVYPTYLVLTDVSPGTVNDTAGGRIVGVRGFSTAVNQFLTHGFLQVLGQPILDLGAFSTPERFSTATCLNVDGDVWGYGDTPEGSEPLLWVESRPIAVLPTLYGMGGNVSGCNDLGDAAGLSYTPDSQTQCTWWGIDGSMRSCHPSESQTSQAEDMNNAREIIGNAQVQGQQLGFLWGTYYFFWLRPGPGDTHAWGYGTNDVGDMVGKSCRFPTPRGICHAAMWYQGTFIPITPLVPDSNGWVLESAIGTSNDGKIIVEGTLNGQPRLALLTPIDSTFVTYWQPRLKAWILYVQSYCRFLRSWYRWIQAFV